MRDRPSLSTRRRVVAATAAAMLLAGLAATSTSAVAGGVHFRITALPGGAGHTEPSLVVDRDGRAYVSAIAGIESNTTNGELGTPIWRSRDYAHWTKLKTATLGPAGSPLGGGDSALVLDAKGDVFATDLWLGDDSISISTDHGDSFVGGPVSHRVADDRTWLAFSPKDNVLYQVYDGVDGLYIARADLGTPLGARGALTFAFTQRIVAEVPVSSFALDALPLRQAVAPPGGIAVDPRTGQIYVSYGDQSGLAVATSKDEGLTWSIGHIPGTSTSGSYLDDGWNFSPVATDSSGAVYVVWSQVQGQGATPAKPRGTAVKLAVSTTHGATWKVVKVHTAVTAVLPALTVRGPGRVGVAWVDTSSIGNPNTLSRDTAWTLRYAEVRTAGAPCQRSYVVDANVHRGSLFSGPQGGDRGMGDFFQAVALPGNAALVAYTRGSEASDAAVVASVGPHASAC